MKVGVTGSRHRRPGEAVARLVGKLVEMGATELHHGDCLGWDQQAHYAARALGLIIVAHPPSNGSLRAHCEADEAWEPKPYLDRNKDIVTETDFLIAAPDGPERARSGTWSTVRFARSIGKHGLIIPWD